MDVSFNRRNRIFSSAIKNPFFPWPLPRWPVLSLFFFVTNFGHWLIDPVYAKNLVGLTQCYVAALPFFRNAILGDLFYTAGSLCGAVLIEKKTPSFKPLTQSI